MSSEIIVSVKQQLETIRPDFDSLNLNNLSFNKEVEFAIQILQKNEYLLTASTPESRMNAIKNVALSGLTLNPIMKLCYLIPRSRNIKVVTPQGTRSKKIVECLAEPSYMGLCKILTDSGSVIGVSATIVYEKEADSLEYQDGIGGHANHKPYVGLEDPGKPVACYAKAKLPSGITHTYLIRPFQWNDIRERSESVKSYREKVAKGEYAAIPVWISDEDEMIRKTAVKNLYKYLPKTDRALMVAAAFAMDNEVNGIDFESEATPKRNSANVTKKTDPIVIDILDPANEEHQAMMKKLEDVINDKEMPEYIEIGGTPKNVANAFNKIQEAFIEGKLHIEKLTKYIEFYQSHLQTPDFE